MDDGWRWITERIMSDLDFLCFILSYTHLKFSMLHTINYYISFLYMFYGLRVYRRAV